jgi:hypothetical protein
MRLISKKYSRQSLQSLRERTQNRLAMDSEREKLGIDSIALEEEIWRKMTVRSNAALEREVLDLRAKLQEMQRPLEPEPDEKTNPSAKTIADLRSELNSVRAELVSNQKALRSSSADQKSRQLRLERALSQVSKYEKALEAAKFSKSSIDADHSGTNKERRELQSLVHRLETQRRELVFAIKKQQAYIGILKRQKIHADASKLLDLTEEKFIKAVGWCDKKENK